MYVRTEPGAALPSADEHTLFVAVSSRRASPAADGGRLNAADYAARHFGSDRAVTESAGDLREQISQIAGTDGRSLSSAVFFLEKGDRLRVDVASACAHFAPHGNVRGSQYLVREPKVAHNAVRADASSLVLFAAEKG